MKESEPFVDLSMHFTVSIVEPIDKDNGCSGDEYFELEKLKGWVNKSGRKGVPPTALNLGICILACVDDRICSRN